MSYNTVLRRNSETNKNICQENKRTKQHPVTNKMKNK